MNDIIASNRGFAEFVTGLNSRYSLKFDRLVGRYFAILLGITIIIQESQVGTWSRMLPVYHQTPPSGNG
jgi:hypothetical protein